MDDVVKVKVLDVDMRGRIKLSMKDLIEDESVSS
jgi:polyribonucleotide nucleotidyltransferase